MDMDPELRRKSDEAIDLVMAARRPVAVAGPAGCGKTEAIKYITEKVGRVQVMSFTNQAARMLRKRGITDAATIHSTIYYPDNEAKRDAIKETRIDIDRVKQHGGAPGELARLEQKLDQLMKPGFVLNEESDLRRANLCIIDEVSMLGERLGNDVLSFDRPTLVFGDPHQLGPVNEEPCFALTEPDIRLDKIFRHNGGILQLATAIREGTTQTYRPAKVGPVHVRRHSAMSNSSGPGSQRDWMLRVDQIICADNRTRRAINKRMLRYLDFGERTYPMGEGEKLVCLQNYPDHGLLNGTPIRIVNVTNNDRDRWLCARVEKDDGDGGWVDCGEMRVFKGWFEYSNVVLSQKVAVTKRNYEFSGQIAYDAHERLGIEVDWAWAITTHKAQGNEWDRVLVVLAGWPDRAKEPEDWRRNFYTAVTRARDELRVITHWGQS